MIAFCITVIILIFILAFSICSYNQSYIDAGYYLEYNPNTNTNYWTKPEPFNKNNIGPRPKTH